MGRPSKERLEELIHASWRDLTQSERRSATREMDRRANNDSAVKIFAEDLLRAHPGLSALEAWDKAKGLHETEQRAPMVYGNDAVETRELAHDLHETESPTPPPPVYVGTADDAADPVDLWLDELPVDEFRGPNAVVMDMIAECRRHPDKWRRIGVFGSRKRAQTRAASIRRSKAWAGFQARAIDRADRHETWVSYRGDAR